MTLHFDCATCRSTLTSEHVPRSRRRQNESFAHHNKNLHRRCRNRMRIQRRRSCPGPELQSPWTKGHFLRRTRPKREFYARHETCPPFPNPRRTNTMVPKQNRVPLSRPLIPLASETTTSTNRPVRGKNVAQSIVKPRLIVHFTSFARISSVCFSPASS